MRGSRNKNKQAQGVVSKCSSRIAKSGSYAHAFFIGDNKYIVFIADDLSPVTDGDMVFFEYEERRLKTGHRSKYNAVISNTLTISAPAELGDKIGGNVYILSNTSMPGLLKVGYTTGSAAKRADELSRVTSVPTGFKVEWTLPVHGDPRAVEQRAHALLAESKHGKEFFKVSLNEAKDACIKSFAQLYPEQASLMDEAFSARAENEINRRNKLAEIAEENKRKQIEEQKRREYEQSDEGQWRSKGVCRMVVHDFSVEPNRGSVSFISKIFGATFEDYMEFEIKPLQSLDTIEWSVAMTGRKHEQRIHEYKSFPNKNDTLEYVANTVQLKGVFNYRATIDVPNNLIENPPMPDVLPRYYYGPPVVLEVSEIDNLIIRPAALPPRRSRFER